MTRGAARPASDAARCNGPTMRVASALGPTIQVTTPSLHSPATCTIFGPRAATTIETLLVPRTVKPPSTW